MKLALLLLAACGGSTYTAHGIVTGLTNPPKDPVLTVTVRTPEEADASSRSRTLPCYKTACGDVAPGDYVQLLCYEDVVATTNRTVCGLVDHHPLAADAPVPDVTP